MAIDPTKLRPLELCGLLNSTPLGTVLSERDVRRHRAKAGLRISAKGDPNRIDLFRYIGWVAAAWSEQKAARSADPIGAGDFDELTSVASRPSSSPKASRPNRTATKSQLMAAVGLSPNAIEQYIAKGLPCDYTSRGVRKFDPDECRRWLKTHGSVRRRGNNKVGIWAPGEESDSPTIDGKTPAMIELELAATRARQAKLALDQKEGKLVDARQVEAVFTRHLLTIRTAIDALPAKTAGRVLEALELDSTKLVAVTEAVAAAVREVLQIIVHVERDHAAR